MRLKDHYQTLGIAPAASLQEIKKAYRKLALQYHPDKNADDAFATAQFKEVHEAYSILSNTNKRRAYDEERWLSGMGNRMQHREHITPQWILKEALRLREHMKLIDTYRMSHQSLRDYILLILSDAHIAILHKHPDAQINENIVNEILLATKNLELQYQDSIMRQLAQVANGDQKLLQLLYETFEKRKKQAYNYRLLPFWVVLTTILLAILMYFYARLK